MTRTVLTQLKTIAFSESIQQLTNGFPGRTWVFNKIDHWLEQKDQQFLVIAGELGLGKSVIAAHLIQARKDIVGCQHLLMRLKEWSIFAAH